ncbi:putative defensin-like protein 256 [Raphanus sativus]|uniref:Defensin-like protein 256 n=1 Tax=Raphanus sativus TaxID=3726 RepID=A0A9W3CDQ7_RAPSA|nr:putative defensin-like protein 256 [Raphanus sativus]
MKTIFLKFLLLACLVVVIFRQNLAVENFCKNNNDCKKLCGRYCNIRGSCVCSNVYNNAINIDSTNNPCIPEHPGCHGGPPPKQLKV